MESTNSGDLESRYADGLLSYCADPGEEQLYAATMLSEEFIAAGMGPDDIVGCHFDAVQALLASDDLPRASRVRAMGDAHQFLLEVMISYGVRYKEYLELKVDEAVRTAEIRLAYERQRAEDAERAQEEKLEILAGIAHELTTPITIAKGNVSFADRLLQGGKFTDVPPLLGEANDALDRLSYLTGQLVAASRDEESIVELEPLNVLEVVHRAARWAQPAARERSLTLIEELHDGKLFIDGNADALLTVFANLLSNAIRYTPAGGRVWLHCEPGENAVIFEVRDTGIGMSEDEIARIFEKFYRAPNSRRMSSLGLGMGLAIAQRLVEVHGGTIHVESEPDKGSAFRVTLPLWDLEGIMDTAQTEERTN